VSRASDQDNAVHVIRREYSRGVARILKRVIGIGIDSARLDAEIPLQRIVHRTRLD